MKYNVGDQVKLKLRTSGTEPTLWNNGECDIFNSSFIKHGNLVPDDINKPFGFIRDIAIFQKITHYLIEFMSRHETVVVAFLEDQIVCKVYQDCSSVFNFNLI